MIPCAVFFASGLAALTYEISWSRQIGLLMGNTASAAATVLASYFVGLALGYALAGRLAAKAVRPLLWYGLLELAAAGWACLVPLVMLLLRQESIIGLMQSDVPHWQAAIRAGVCIVLFLPATTALGATLPLMARWIEQIDPEANSRIAFAYGLNTIGGLAGVLIATIYLLATVGVTASSYAAAALSAACGVAAICLSQIVADRSAISKVDRRAIHDHRGITVLVGTSGFVTLALEVLYTRLFALTFHNSTYTFGLVVAVVLCGLAIGAWVAAWLAKRVDIAAAAGWALLLGGAAVSFSTLLFLHETGVEYFRGGSSFAEYMTASVGLVAVVVFPPSVLLGTVLPLLWDVSHRGEVSGKERADLEARANSESTVSSKVGRLTAVNTLSAAVGALAASFLLLPAIGLWNSFALLAAIPMLAGICLMFRRPSLTFWATALAAGCLAFSAWHVTSNHSTLPRNKTLIRRSEGAYGWIDVLRDERTGSLSLRENVNYTHGSTASGRWERRQSHIPLLLHPQPRDVAYLGCGTGATAGGAVMHDEVESITVIELIPEVIDAARMFGESNFGVLEDSRTTVKIDDARHALLASERQFDVIISDLFVPWESKTGYLYTVDHYTIARQRLKPGGLCCQWLAMWQLGEAEFEMIADGFAKVFPHTTLWWGKVEYDRSIIGLVGSEEPLAIDNDGISQRLQEIYAAGPEDLRLNRPVELPRRFLGRWVAREGALLNTDEHPWLEFAMPLTYANRQTLKRSAMQGYFDRRLTHLPQEGMQLSGFSGDGSDAASRRDWQQLQLRK